MTLRTLSRLSLLAITLLHSTGLYAACTSPPGDAGSVGYNSDYAVMQFCNGSSWVSMAASGAVSESDPHVGTLTANNYCTSNGAGTQIVCTTSSIPTTVLSGTLQAAQFPALTGNVTTTAGSLTTTIAAGVVTNAMLAGAIDLTTKVTGTLPVANGGTGTATGSITGTGALTFTAGGTNQNVTLTPSGTGYTILNGNVGIGTSTPSALLTLYGGPMYITSSSGTEGVIGYNIGSRMNVRAGAGRGLSLGANDTDDMIRIASAGNVGIGTAAPDSASALHIHKASGNNYAYLTNGGATGADNVSLWFASNYTTSTNWAGIGISGGDGKLRLSGTGSLAAPGMTFDDSNNVGIGTTAPGLPLDVYGAAALGVPATAQMRAMDTTTAAQDVGASILLGGYHTAQTGAANFAAIKGGKENATSGNFASYLSFFTRLSGSALAERMRIDSTGALGIGTIAPGTALDLNGAMTYRGMAAPSLSPAGQGRIYFDSTANVFKVSQNGGAYANLVGGGATALSGLSDVTITSAANNDILQYDSGSSKWVNTTLVSAVAGAAGPSFSVHKNGTNQTVGGATSDTLITWSTTELFDTNNNFASNVFTPTVAGRYFLTASLPITTWGTCSAGMGTAIYIRKNGAAIAEQIILGNGSYAAVSPVVSVVAEANGVSDYFDVTYTNGCAGSTTINGSAGGGANFSGGLLAPLVSGTVAGTGTSGKVPVWTSGNAITNATALSYATSGSLLTITAQAATDKPLIVKGAASQSANLQEWQNSSGTALTSISSSGALTVTGTVTATTFSGSGASLTSIPIGSAISGLGTGVATFLATPSSANLLSAMTDETGTGSLVFGTSPTIASPTITTSLTLSAAHLVLDNAKMIQAKDTGGTTRNVLYGRWSNDATYLDGGTGGIYFRVSDSTVNSLYLAPTTGNATFYGTVTGDSFSGVGTSLTALNASNLASGTVPTARLGSGTADSTTYLRGDGTWATPSGGGGGTPAYNAGSSTTINWSNGNQQYTTASCGPFTFSNMGDGEVYTLAVQGATAATCSFTHTGLSFRLPPGHGANSASTHTLYSFARMGTVVYVTWIKGI